MMLMQSQVMKTRLPSSMALALLIVLLVINPVSCWIAASSSGYTISSSVTVNGGVNVINSTGQSMDVGVALLALQRLVQQQASALQALQQQVTALSARTSPFGNRVRLMWERNGTSCSSWQLQEGGYYPACDNNFAVTVPFASGASVDANIVCDAQTLCTLHGPGTFDITVWMQGGAGTTSIVWEYTVYVLSGWVPSGLTAPTYVGLGGAILAFEAADISYNPTTFPATATLTIPAGQSTVFKVALSCVVCGGGAIQGNRVLEIQQTA